MTSKLLGNCSSLNSLTPSYNRLSKSNSAADESRTTSVMALEDVELNDEDFAPEHHYTQEENAKIHKGMFNLSYQFCLRLLTFFAGLKRKVLVTAFYFYYYVHN